MVVFALLLVNFATASLWNNKNNLTPTVLSSPAISAWAEPCGNDLFTLKVHSLDKGFADGKTIVSCRELSFGQPTLSYTKKNNRLFLVWSQSPSSWGNKQTTQTGVFVSTSSNKGKTWSPPHRLLARQGLTPTVVKSAAYIYRLWLMWSGPSSKDKNVKFHIQAFNTKNWRAGREVKGIGAFRTVGLSQAMNIYATADGVAAFWRTTADFSSKEGFWHVADTLRSNPQDLGKPIPFVYRGKVGMANSSNIFVGADGLLYSLIEHTNALVVKPQSDFSLYRWRFRAHKFVDVFSKNPILSVPKDITLPSAEIAAGVDAARQLYIAYVSPSPGLAICFGLIGTSACAVSAPGEAYVPYISVAKFSSSGALIQTYNLASPIASASALSGTLSGLWISTRSSIPTNQIIFKSHGVGLFGSLIEVPLQGKAGSSTYIIESLVAAKRAFFLSNIS